MAETMAAQRLAQHKLAAENGVLAHLFANLANFS